MFHLIHLPSATRPPVRFSRPWSAVRCAEDLPERLFVGDLDPSSFVKDYKGDYSASYRDAEFELNVIRRGDQLNIRESFDGHLVLEATAPASTIGGEVIRFVARPMSAYDVVLRPRYEAYNVCYPRSDADEQKEHANFFPDGVFQTLLLLIPLDAELADRLIQATEELLQRGTASFGGCLQPTAVSVSFLEGLCPDVPDDPFTHQAWALLNGYLAAEPPFLLGAPGERALVATWTSYILKITFPLRDGLRILETLTRYGVLKSPSERHSERIGLLLSAVKAATAQIFEVWSCDGSRCIRLPVGSLAVGPEQEVEDPCLDSFAESVWGAVEEYLQVLQCAGLQREDP